ncbi:MAG: NAD-dependent malic enzyme [Gemmatimonadales bacterium]|jgi:malic enzyme
MWSVKTDPRTGAEYLAVHHSGRPVLLNPFTNKGTAFTPEERRSLRLAGLVPPATFTIEEQLPRVYENYEAKTTDLERFIYLASLQDRNETLFFRLVHEHIDEMMPVVYTPVVGEACQNFSHIWRRARGLYVSYEQRDEIESVLANHPRPPAVIVVTDGERILGLGDQGAGGMGIPIGKLCLYTLCAGIPPHLTLPIMLDVGTDNEDRLNDPLYVGLRQKRIRGKEYQDFVDKFVEAVQRVYPEALLQWEDFLKGNAIFQLKRFRDRLCTFNDDIQGTAGVVVAGVFSGLRITGQAMSEQRILFAGAGASAQGISDLLVSAMLEEGLSLEEARRRIWTVDSRGLVTKAREGLEAFKATYARDVAELEAYDCKDRSRVTLEETVQGAKPTILIGTSGTPGMFSEPVVRAMAELNERPIIFPLSNPTSKSECTAQQAIAWSEGRAIVATGSPFDPVEYNGKRYRIGQGNNAFVFPGVGLGVWVGKVKRVTDGMFLAAAKALAAEVTEADLAEVAVYPRLARIRECSRAVACAVVRRAVEEGHADRAVLADLEDHVAAAMWFPEYRPIRYEPPVW